MQLKKNIKVGKIKLNLIIFILILPFLFFSKLNANNELEGNITNIKILDKISSKNELVKLQNGIETTYKDLLIKSIKCRNSEFDDNPEITAYVQVRDLISKNNDDVYIFNGWMFSSSPSLKPFDHPVYDIWLVGCF
tara:strand:+ start:382 stop:789 length:408 start_codon:yes stop_codon:yes gene_type:complete